MVLGPGRQGGQQLLGIGQLWEHVDEQNGTDVIDTVQVGLQGRHIGERDGHQVEAEGSERGLLRHSHLVPEVDHRSVPR